MPRENKIRLYLPKILYVFAYMISLDAESSSLQLYYLSSSSEKVLGPIMNIVVSEHASPCHLQG